MITFELAVVVALILCNGFLAMSELAVVSSRRSRLQNLVKRRYRSARTVLTLLDDPSGFLSTVQIGITLIGVLAGAFGGATLAARFGMWLDSFPSVAPYGEPIAFAVTVICIAFVQLMVGELVPKRIALSDPERIALSVAPVMRGLSWLASPAVWLLRHATDAVLAVLGISRRRASTVTEDEIRMLIAEGTRAGVFVPKEREMIEGVLRLADRTARAIMTPRTEVAWLDEHATPADIVEQLRVRRLSRFPVCRGTIDNPLGIVHMKDLARAALAGEPLELRAIAAPPLVVLDGTPVLKVVESLRRERVHMAIIVDEYGTTQGVVTLADILEAVTGTLPEQGAAAPENRLLRRDDGSWLVDGSVAIDEFEDRVGLIGLRGSRSFDTVAGYVLYRLGRLPNVGESFSDRSGRYEVVDMDGRRIDKLVFTPRPEEEG
jgi:magnesium and cobalt exporter, CNNM family